MRKMYGTKSKKKKVCEKKKHLPENENSHAEKFENHLSVEACAVIGQTVA